jgi:hypothetical protein
MTKKTATKKPAKKSTKKTAPKRKPAPKSAAPAAVVPEVVHVLKCVGPNGEAYGGFRWPLTVGATVEAPDFRKNAECGRGLHGWLDGQGDHAAAGARTTDPQSVWMVLDVVKAAIIDLGGKVKFPRCVVRFVGTRDAAAAEIARLGAVGAIIGAVVSVGANGGGAVGALGSLSGGNHSTLSGGDGSILSGGYGSTLSGGDGSILSGFWWDATASRWRLAVAYVGEDGIEPKTEYIALVGGTFERVNP